jgi:hypothetical protein
MPRRRLNPALIEAPQSQVSYDVTAHREEENEGAREVI